MLHPIRQVLSGKQGLCRDIFESLPEWFGIPSAIDDYCRRVEELPMFAVGHQGRDAGMMALRPSFDESWEIFVMGIRPEYHRLGLGRALVDHAEDYVRSQRARLLYAKTLGPSHPDPHYAATRSFYEALGFIPMDELEGVFNPGNPCLILVKPIALAG
jgi:ribosomal protein S18 acetylase RimI-like enzyme